MVIGGAGFDSQLPLPSGPWTHPFLTQRLGFLKRGRVINSGTNFTNLFVEYNTESPELGTR